MNQKAVQKEPEADPARCNPGGLCYDHDLGRFSPIFGEKWAFFLKPNFIVNTLSKKHQFFAKIFGEGISKSIYNIGP
jgi:hypothetical protein